MDEGIRQKILALLAQKRTMTIATLRPDGWPQAAVVGYANRGLNLYFLCAANGQKAANLARDARVSLTVYREATQAVDIAGLSIAAHAHAVDDPPEAAKALSMLIARYPARCTLPQPGPNAADIRIFRVTPTIISVIDYTQGFAHTDCVVC